MSFEKDIKKFCDTENVKYLEKLPKEYQVFFQKYSALALLIVLDKKQSQYYTTRHI